MSDPFPYGRAAGTDDAIACVRGIYDAFARRDLEAALPLLAPDFELFPVGTSRLIGRTAAYRGPDGMRDYFDDVREVWSELSLHADDIRAVGDAVIVFGHVRGRTVRDGEPFRRRAVWTWKVRDGRAISARVAEIGDP